jgi:hypothetical protein
MNLKYKREVLKIIPASVWLENNHWKGVSGSPIGSDFVPPPPHFSFTTAILDPAIGKFHQAGFFFWESPR